ncbi:MAG: tetratricopeptide repeat protein [Verrucomicrobia bacterium]|nr:tetratricopeptide repeat protein [Verrucomicrobiota bacterium]
MSTPATPSQPNPAGDDRNLVAVDASTAGTFEDKLRLFWEKNRNAVMGVCAVVVLAIAGKGGWEYLQHQKELEVGKAYAAATTPEQLKSFAAAHDGHPLAGVVQLRLADDAYKAGKPADALAGYEKAQASLKEGPLAARAKLGRALALAQSGKAADSTRELKQLADDAKQFKAVRTEAAYHLTSLAVEAKDAVEAQKYVDQLMQIDVSSAWTQRAMAVRATLPASPAPAAATPAGEGKKEESAGVQVKLPGK